MNLKYNVIVPVFILAITVSFPLLSHAISGACSFHNGVNCNAGANLNGNVICNDGWTNSSVYFYDVDECKIQCIPPYSIGCKTENDYNILVQQGIAAGRSRYTPEIEGGNLYACRSQITSYQLNLAKYNNCLSYASQVKQQQLKEIEAEIERLKTPICPENASYDTSTNKCICDTGYETSSDKTSCMQSVTCPINSTKIGQTCVCDTGYLIKSGQCITYTQDCQNTFGNNVIGSQGSNGNSSCICESGYQWNQDSTACILVKEQPTTTVSTVIFTTTTTTTTIYNNPIIKQAHVTKPAITTTTISQSNIIQPIGSSQIRKPTTNIFSIIKAFLSKIFNKS